MNDVNLSATLPGHQNPIYSMVVDVANNKLYSAGNDKGIVEWNLETKQFSRVLCAVPASVYQMRILASSGYLVAALRKGGLLVIDREETKLIAKLEVQSGAVFALAIIDFKNEMIAVDESGMAYVWSLEDFKLLYSFRVSSQTVRSIAVSKENQKIYFGDKSGTVHVHNLMDYHQEFSLKVHEQNVTSLCLVGNKLISGGRDAKMYQLHLETLEKEREITPHMFTVYGIEEVEEGELFATVSRDKTLKVWDREFKLKKNLSRDKGIDSHTLSINTMAFNAVTKELYTAGDDKLIKVWQIS